MGFIGIKNGMAAPWFVPDHCVPKWKALGHRIKRHAKPEDGTSDKIVPLSKLKAISRQAAASIDLSPVEVAASPSPPIRITEEEPRVSRKRKRVE